MPSLSDHGFQLFTQLKAGHFSSPLTSDPEWIRHGLALRRQVYTRWQLYLIREKRPLTAGELVEGLRDGVFQSDLPNDPLWRDNPLATRQLAYTQWMEPSASSISGGSAIARCERTVFLTFDDGIQPGTMEAYEILKNKGVKATFFLTGAHVRYAIEQYNQVGLLQSLASDPNIDLGNHSSSHANQYYEGYYDKGGVLLNDGETRRTVLDDFRKCDETLSLNTGGNISRQWKFARLPGRNTWRAVPGVEDETYDNEWLGPGDTFDEANELKAAGYQIYGWDFEWKMDFAGTSSHSDYDAEVDRECMSDSDTICWREAEYRKSFRFMPDLDRVYDDGEIAAAAAMAKFDAWFSGPRKENKLIVLMHERAFRGPEKYTVELSKFIDALKRMNVCFDKISNY